MTFLPAISKGIQIVEDALMAVQHGASAIYISNHGGRQPDTVQSTMEVVLSIYQNALQILNQTEVLAHCGVRHGTDMLKLLVMGVGCWDRTALYVLECLWSRRRRQTG